MKFLFSVCILLTGCASYGRVELEHVSHPFAGWPVERQCGSEDGVTQASAILGWKRGGAYVEAGMGYNLEGKNGGGFYGPAVTGTVRAGYQVDFKGH